jgi:hypothetical protein
MSAPIGSIKVMVSIPITPAMVSPDDLPTAGDVLDWLIEEYLGPVGLIADFDQEAATTMIVVWQDGQKAMRHTVVAGWTEADSFPPDGR